MQKTEKARIHRTPNERRLADAIAALHEEGPRLVCQLWERIDELEGRSKDLDARERAERLVAGLR